MVELTLTKDEAIALVNMATFGVASIQAALLDTPEAHATAESVLGPAMTGMQALLKLDTDGWTKLNDKILVAMAIGSPETKIQRN